MQARYEDMPEPKFLYGSHYSTPGYVLFYLVRKGWLPQSVIVAIERAGDDIGLYVSCSSGVHAVSTERALRPARPHVQQRE